MDSVYFGELNGGTLKVGVSERSRLDLGTGLDDVFGRFWSEPVNWELPVYSLALSLRTA